MSQNLIDLYTSQDPKTDSLSASKSEKLLWSNCASVELLSFSENDQTIHVIVKKSRLPADKLSDLQAEYQLIKDHLGSLIPSQAFISEARMEDQVAMVTAICSPVSIAYDVFSTENNFSFFENEWKRNKKLRDDLQNFIAGYTSLRNKWFYLDLFGEENLVVTREGRLKYIDSFLVNMANRESLRNISEERFRKLSSIL